MSKSPRQAQPSQHTQLGQSTFRRPREAPILPQQIRESCTNQLLQHSLKLELLTPEQERVLGRQRIEADRDIDLLEKTLAENKPRRNSRLYANIQSSLEEAKKRKDEAVCAFMERNIRLAVKIAWDMGFLPAPLEFRVSSALEGVREAALRFDPDKGGKFSTYAAFWIRQRMFRDSRIECRTIRLSHNMIHRLSIVARAETELQGLYGRAATDVEIAEHLGLKEKQMRAVRLAQQTIAVSLEPGSETIEGIDERDRIADPNAIIPGTADLSSDRLEILNRVLASLDKRELAIISARFDLKGKGRIQTLEELGSHWGLTRERIRQLESIALQKLRKGFQDLDTPNIVLQQAKGQR